MFWWLGSDGTTKERFQDCISANEQGKVLTFPPGRVMIGQAIQGTVQMHSETGKTKMTGQGSTGNVLCAIASFIYPGLGQLCQGRIMAAAVFFFTATLLWIVLLGWIIHIWATVDAARYRSIHFA